MRRRGIRRGNEDEFFDEQGDPDQARLLRDLAADAEIHLLGAHHRDDALPQRVAQHEGDARMALAKRGDPLAWRRLHAGAVASLVLWSLTTLAGVALQNIG